MSIDNQKQAIEFMERLKQNLPLYATILPENAKSLRLNKNIDVSSNQVLVIKELYYAGDEGGILCMLDTEFLEQSLVISITHLKFSEDCPFFEEITDYQESRIINIMIQDGFVGQAKRQMQKKTEAKTVKKRIWWFRINSTIRSRMLATFGSTNIAIHRNLSLGI